MNEQEILAAMATADHGERAMLNRQLIQLRAARRTATQAQSEAVLGAQSVEYLTPGTEHMRHSASTDWINQIAVDHRGDDEIRREATVEAQRWLATKSALVRSDPEELGTQALGYANLWSGQFLQSGTTAKVAFLQRVASLVHIALIPETEDLFEEARKAKVRADAEADANKIASKTADAVVPVVGLPKGPDDEFNEGEWTQRGTVDHSLMGTMPMSLAAARKTASNYYLDMIEDADGNLVDINYYHSYDAPPDVVAKGGWPAPDWPDYDVYCAACGELIHGGIESEGSRKTAVAWRVVQDVGNPGKWVVQKYTPEWGVWGDMGDAVDSQQAAYTKMDAWQADEREFPMESEGSRRTADDRNRQTHPQYGDQTACRVCGMDIEYHGPQDRWVGRGGDRTCADSGAHPVDENGVSGNYPNTPHQPMSDRLASKTAADFTPPPINSADDARNAAIDWQNWMSEQNLSMGEFGDWENYFEDLAAKYPELKEEFQENGIIGFDDPRYASRKTAGTQKSARDLVVGDKISGEGTIARVESNWGTVYVWLVEGPGMQGADLVYNHGDPVRMADADAEFYPYYRESSKTAGNPYPVGSSMWFGWEDDLQAGKQPEGSGPFDSGAPGGGIPLHGPLSPEQEEWMKRRSSVTAVLSNACTNGNHSSCTGSSCTCPCHDKGTAKDMSGACGDGDHEDCKMTHGHGPDDCQCAVCIKNGVRTSSRTAAGDIETWVSDGSDATDGGEPSWTSTAPPMETQDHEKLWTDVPVGSSLGSRQLRHQAGVTWYPDMDSAGNMNPSGYGMVVEDEESSIGGGYSVVNNGCSWDQAQSMYPGVNRASHTIPVTVDAHVHNIAAGSKVASSDSDDQQAWWDSMDIDTQKRYVTDQHAKYPDTRHPDALAIDLIEIDAAAAADAIMPGRGPGWYEVYAEQLANLGVIRENGYNRLASYEKPEEDVILPENTCSVCGDAIEKNDGEEGYHHDNGEKHDHEAKPGSSKQSRKTAAGEWMGQSIPATLVPGDQVAIHDLNGASDTGVVVQVADGQTATTADGFDSEPLIFVERQDGSRTWIAENWLTKQSRKTALTGLDDLDSAPCSVCGAPATKYAYQEGTRASGFFACDAHIGRFAPGRIVVDAARKTATLSDDELQPIADSYGMTLEELKAALDAQVAPWDHEKYAAFENPPGKQLDEKVVVTDNTDGVAFGWVVDDEGDKIDQDSINEDHGSELKKDAGYQEGVDCPGSNEWIVTTESRAECPECHTMVPVSLSSSPFFDDDGEKIWGGWFFVHLAPGMTLSDRTGSRTGYFNPAWADQGASGSQSSDDDFVYAPRKERHAYTKWVDDQAHANPDGWTPPSFDDWSAGHTGSRKMADLDMNRLGEAINAQDFDHCFTLHPDGSITDAPGVYAPSVFHDESNDIEIDGSGWTAMTGLTGQDSYSGAVMHASEYIGSGVASVMMELVEDGPKTFVITTVEVMPEGDDDEPEPAGWTILYRDARTASRTAEWKDTFLEKNDGPKEDSTTEVVPIVGEPADDTAMFEPSDELNGHWKPPKKPTTSQRVSALDHSLFE